MSTELTAAIKTHFPGFRAPAGQDLGGSWLTDQGSGPPPYLTCGDFNGDGLTDVAMFVVSDYRVKFLVFHQTSTGEYDPIQVQEVQGNSSFQTRSLSTLGAGLSDEMRSEQSSGLDITTTVRFKRDAIVIDVDERGRAFYYWDGTEYQSWEYGSE